MFFCGGLGPWKAAASGGPILEGVSLAEKDLNGAEGYGSGPLVMPEASEMPDPRLKLFGVSPRNAASSQRFPFEGSGPYKRNLEGKNSHNRSFFPTVAAAASPKDGSRGEKKNLWVAY